MTNSNTLASAGTADLYAASAARIFAGPGPRVALAPDGEGGAPLPSGTSDDGALDDLTDDDLGLGAEEDGHLTPPAEDDNPEGEPGAGKEGQGDEREEDDEEVAKDKKGSTTDDDIKVKLDDGQEATLGELKKGYLRQSDYTRKTQEVARDRGEVGKATERLIEADKQTKALFQAVVKMAENYIPGEPDLNLLQSNASEYHLRKELRARGLSQLQELVQASQQQDRGVKGLSEADQTAALGREVASLVEKAPELKDVAKRAALFDDINTRAGGEYGFSPEELAGVTDHRHVLVLRDALAYRKLQANKSATIARVQATAPMRSATRQAPGQRVQAGDARNVERARRTGAEEDVSRLLTDADLGGV